MPPPSAVVVSRAPDAAVDCAAILKALTDRFGGKGGGRSDLAQGGGLQGSAEDFIASRGAWCEALVAQGFSGVQLEAR